MFQGRSVGALVATLRFTLAATFSLLSAAVPTTLLAAETTDRFALPPTDDGLPGAGPLRRYEAFQRVWREQRAGWATQVAKDQGAVVFVGDSITAGWRDLAAAFPGMKVANRGISGDTSRGVLIRLREDVLTLKPAAVVLLIGTNDIADGATPEVIAGNVKLILAALAEWNPKMPVVLCQVMPSATEKKRSAEHVNAVNAQYQTIALNQAAITLLETYPLFADAKGDARAGEFPDLLHPSERGYAKWAAALRPVLSTLGLFHETPALFELEPGFVSLFNGRDLTGWGYRPTSAEDIEAARKRDASNPRPPVRVYTEEPISFSGRSKSPEGRYVVVDAKLVVSTPPEYRKIQQLWTEQEFPQNFILKLEFRATPNTDSGVYLRGPQLQVRDYLVAGPYTSLKAYRPQDWNELVVTVTNNVAVCVCNGEVLEAAFRLPATGPIGLEGDRGQMEYRRIRIRTTP